GDVRAVAEVVVRGRLVRDVVVPVLDAAGEVAVAQVDAGVDDGDADALAVDDAGRGVAERAGGQTERQPQRADVLRLRQIRIDRLRRDRGEVHAGQMDGLIARNRHSAMLREIHNIGAVDVGRKAVNRRKLRLDRVPVLLERVDDVGLGTRRHRDDDGLVACSLNAVFNVGLRRNGARARQDNKYCEDGAGYTSGKIHDLYYSKVSAKILQVILIPTNPCSTVG